jgi:hypothetical protein
VFLGAWSCGGQARRMDPTAGISVLVRADSGSTPGMRVDSLDYPYQAPWRRDFYVEIALPESAPATLGSVRLVFEVWMGPLVYGGPDGDVLLKEEVDRRGSWVRSSLVSESTLSRGSRRTNALLVGPFEMDSLVPGPFGPQATSWPTRLRISVEVLPAQLGLRSSETLQLEKLIWLR